MRGTLGQADTRVSGLPTGARKQPSVPRRALASRRDHALFLTLGEERKLPRRPQDDVAAQGMAVQPVKVRAQTVVGHLPTPKGGQHGWIDARRDRHAAHTLVPFTPLVRLVVPSRWPYP